MNLPGEPKRRTTQENHPGGTEQENRILSEKIRTMDVVGEAIGENSKPAQDSLLSPAEDEALASLRGPTKATTRKATRRPASDVEGFDEWYDLYARKEARGAAEKAYRKAVKGGVPPAVLLACLRRHLPAMQRKIAAGERQYVPYPASWLNAERWADGLSNEQKRALCAPGSDVERLLDEALGAGVGESEAPRELQAKREPVAGGATSSRQPAPSNDGFWDEERDGPLPDRQSQPSINAASQEAAPAELQPGDREMIGGWYLDVVTEEAYEAIDHKSIQFPDLERHVRDWMMAGLDPEEIRDSLAALKRKGISAHDTERNLGRWVLARLKDLTPQERAARRRPVEIETAADRKRQRKLDGLRERFPGMGLFESEAREEFSRLDPSDDLFREMLAGLKNHAASELWQDRRNIPTLATWLCERQWERRLELPEWKRPEVIAARKAAAAERLRAAPKPGAAQADNPYDDSPKSPAQPAMPTPPPGPKPSEISQIAWEMLGEAAEQIGDEIDFILMVRQWLAQGISPEAIYAGAGALRGWPQQGWKPSNLDDLVKQRQKELAEPEEAAGGEDTPLPIEDPPGETDLFAQVSQRYPKQQGLLRARQAFERLAPDRTLADRMVAAIEAQKKSLEWKRENGRFIPSFERWIGEERWNDKLTPEPIYYSHGF